MQPFLLEETTQHKIQMCQFTKIISGHLDFICVHGSQSCADAHARVGAHAHLYVHLMALRGF